ncbi:MAG TPA: XRE family transcriptional regulator [Oscillospiraceae bacterium]|nr:XRE family transcriptional regulator [Oscillospiraceae bacterium]HRW57802.1 XRE family transcriptional regulator [Oscillospiraceae bacterium]
MNRIKELRKEKMLSMREVARQLNIPYTTYVNYEKGYREPNSETLIAIADFYHTSLDYLLGKDPSPQIARNIIPVPDMVLIPLLGTIACGEPILAEENIDGYVKSPAYAEASFALTCKGDSMIDARILDGDIVLIRQQSDVDNGDIAAVLIENEATLKRVYKDKDGITLVAANQKYAPWRITGPELEEVRILGKAVYFISSVK